MSANHWWVCRTCGAESYDSVAAYHHTADTGHDGHALAATGVGPGEGSSAGVRRQVLQQTAEAVRASKVKGGRA